MPFVHKMRVHLGDDERSPMRDYDVQYHWIRGAPAVRYQRNGDPGWPGDPDEVQIVSIEPPPMIVDWAPKRSLDDELDRIEQFILENHNDGPDDDYERELPDGLEAV
jgi:hypothetical protein